MFTGRTLLGFLLLFCHGAASDYDGDFCSEDPLTLNGTTGSLALANYPGNISCSWKIQFPTNETGVFIRFQTFQTNIGDQLTVFNGSSTKDKKIGTFDGNIDFKIVYSNADNTLVTFKSTENSTGNKGFNLTYTIEDCSYIIKNPAQAIQSPVYVNSNDSFKCLYTIPSGLNAKAVALTFTSFNFKKGTFKVFNKNAKEITRVPENGKNPGDVISHDSTLVLNFTFATSVTGQQFAGYYSFVDQECSKNLTLQKNATIATIPSTFPAKYSPNLDCLYVIRSPVGTTVSLDFNQYNVQGPNDFVVVKDGNSALSRDLAIFRKSSNAKNQTYMSTGNALWVQLRTGLGANGTGLNATFAPQEYNKRYFSSGTFSIGTKPNMTNDDDGIGSNATVTSVTIVLQFEASADDQVYLKFNKNTKLDGNATVDCYEGFSISGSKIATFKQGSALTRVFANGQNMLMVVIGDKTVTANGTSMNFYVAGSFSSRSNDGSLRNSYGESDVYSLEAGAKTKSQQSQWLIHNANNNEIVSLRVNKLKLDSNSHLTIGENPSKTGTPFTVLAGMSVPVIYMAQASVKYNSTNQTQEGTVLAASYTKLPECKQAITKQSGSIQSPEFPNQYPVNAVCNWNISIPKGKVVHLSFMTFDLSNNHTVQLTSEHSTWYKNKTVTNTTSYGSFTGKVPPNDVIIAKNGSLLVKFSSKSNNGKLDVGKGFEINYEILECGAHMTDKSGNLTSPANKTGTCMWIITLAPNTTKSTNIVEFSYSVSDISKLDIRDGPSADSLPFPLTEKKTDGKLLSRANSLWVRYTVAKQAAGNKGGQTFTLSYSTKACDKSQQCKNGICMHKDWKCNGRDDCGDGSDEEGCVYGGGKKGYAPWALGVAILLTFVFTLVLACVIPVIYKRLRYPHYSELRDSLSPVDT